jgi:hypothetical protein
MRMIRGLGRTAAGLSIIVLLSVPASGESSKPVAGAAVQKVGLPTKDCVYEQQLQRDIEVNQKELLALADRLESPSVPIADIRKTCLEQSGGQAWCNSLGGGATVATGD